MHRICIVTKKRKKEQTKQKQKRMHSTPGVRQWSPTWLLPPAQCSLTSVSGQERVHFAWYGRMLANQHQPNPLIRHPSESTGHQKTKNPIPLRWSMIDDRIIDYLLESSHPHTGHRVSYLLSVTVLSLIDVAEAIDNAMRYQEEPCAGIVWAKSNRRWMRREWEKSDNKEWRLIRNIIIKKLIIKKDDRIDWRLRKYMR